MKNENIIEIDGKKYKQTFELIDSEKKDVVKQYKKPKFITTNINMPIRWSKAPKGLIVHFHAGWSDDRINSISCLKLGKKNGFRYLAMEENGDVYFPTAANGVNKVSFWGHGYHCGTRHHTDHIGLEIMNSGKLTESLGVLKTWFGEVIDKKNARYVEAKDNRVAGWYEKFTKEQENALIGLCFYMKDKYPSFSFDNVLGHDEVAPGRKNDPGGSLSMTMPQLRELLKSSYEAQNE